MRRVLLFLAALLAAGAVAPAQGPGGPIRKRPRPATAPEERLPAPPRIGESPVERTRDPIAYRPPTDPVLLRAIEANHEFDDKLPSFLCRQFMTRSSSRNLGKKWKEDDVVEAEVLIVDDKEQYRDIKIDGQPIPAKDLSQIGGVWSMGEYGATMYNLFIPPSMTEFTEVGPEDLGDRKTLVYSYEIEQENSRWRLRVNGKKYSPGHRGKVWIDLATGRAIRLEMESTFLPHDFPLSSAAGVLYYDDVEIDGQSYLLPAMAENTMCVRDSARCRRINIDFRDYRKFTSESTLYTTESDIEFGAPIPDEQESESQPKR